MSGSLGSWIDIIYLIFRKIYYTWKGILKKKEKTNYFV